MDEHMGTDKLLSVITPGKWQKKIIYEIQQKKDLGASDKTTESYQGTQKDTTPYNYYDSITCGKMTQLLNGR